MFFSGAALASPYRITEGSATRDKGVLVAGRDGAVLNFQTGLVLRLAAHSELRQHKDTELWLESSGKCDTESFTLQTGRVDARMAPASKRAFMLRTSRGLLAASSGGELTALAQPESGVVAAYAGQILVSTGGKWSKVPAGEAAVVSRAVPSIVLKDLPAAPRWQTTSRLFLASHGSTPISGLSWAGGDGDSGYKITVRSAEDGNVVAERIQRDRSLSDLQLPSGRYAVNVQATDHFGLAGPYSPEHTLTVVGVTEHRGARVDEHGVIHVGVNERVQFTHVLGLLMNTGGASPWVPATESIVLYRRERTHVYFRMAESSEVVSAIIEPRGVVADVYVGSKLATWPNDTVNVTIRLRDESGGNELAHLQPRIDARLGIEPLQLDFQRKGDTFTAKIPPQPGPGPWVVRVTVVDQFGVELGRDFLEIAERPALQATVVAPARVASAR